MTAVWYDMYGPVPDTLFRSKTNHTCHQNLSPSRETVPLKLSKQMVSSFFLVLKIFLQLECLVEHNVAGSDEGGVL
jgi:hypothetical protein